MITSKKPLTQTKKIGNISFYTSCGPNLKKVNKTSILARHAHGTYNAAYTSDYFENRIPLKPVSRYFANCSAVYEETEFTKAIF